MEQGEVYDIEAMRKHIRAFIQSQPRLTKILVLVDSECTDIQESREQANQAERRLSRELSRSVLKYVVVDHSLEGWLLQDSEALRAVLRTRARLSLSINPEQECRPAQRLRSLFQTHRKKKPFMKTVDNIRIAEKVSLDVLRQKSQTFAYFAQVLNDP